MHALGKLAQPKDVPAMLQGLLKTSPGSEREEAEKAIANQLAAILREPQVSVSLMDTAARGPERRNAAAGKKQIELLIEAGAFDFTSWSRDAMRESVEAMDQAIKQILDDCYSEARRILAENRAAVERVSDSLLQQETLTRAEFTALI